MLKAYFHAAPMSKHEHTIALCPAKSLRPSKPVLIIMHRLESEPENPFAFIKFGAKKVFRFSNSAWA